MPLFRRSSISSRSAFSRLYESTRLPVFRYIYGLTGGPLPVVEDLVAETFLKAWKARHGFEGEPQAAIGWLIRIARRLVIDDYRREKVRRLHEPAEELPASPEQNAVEADQRRILQSLLMELTQDSRELLTLRYMLGWKVNEIARHLGWTEDNVSVTIHRLLAKLRQEWPEGHPDEPSFSACLEKTP